MIEKLAASNALAMLNVLLSPVFGETYVWVSVCILVTIFLSLVGAVMYECYKTL